MRSIFRLLLILNLFLFIYPALSPAEMTSENNEKLKKALELFPAADLNKDGILTGSEALEYKNSQTGGTAMAKISKKLKKGGETGKAIAPTYKDIKYGPYKRNILDFYKAKSDKPAPVIVFIHGGGFINGSKEKVSGSMIQQALNKGVSYAAINYRYRYKTADEMNDREKAPIQDVVRDSARAIQFIRSKAKEWNIDKTRIAAYGGSAGAATSIFLAFHDDLADPKSNDPVLRESSRLSAAGMLNGQFSLDVERWKELFGPILNQTHSDLDGGFFYGLKNEEELNTEKGRKIRADVDIVNLITKDDSPVFIFCSTSDAPPAGRNSVNHHPKHSIAIKNKCDQIGVEAVMFLPGAAGSKDKDINRDEELLKFLFKHLKISP